MIYDASTFRRPVTVAADLCIVGSGAGGAMVAAVAAEAGLRVVVLEAGPFIAPEYMSQREEEMIPQLLWTHGGRTTADRAVRVHQGKGVGGSTLHNLNLCKRIHPSLFAQWRRERGLEHLDTQRLDNLYGRVEQMLEVSEVPTSEWNRHNTLLRDACRRLGWAHGGMQHNRTGCVGSGFCEVGCAYDAKNNAAKVLIPRAVRASAQVIAQCEATAISHDGARVTGVEAFAIDPVTGRARDRVRVLAPRVCVAASATATPALLRRSRVPSPEGATGDSLRVHPALIAAGDFEDPVFAWRGIPQSVECTEFLDLDRAHPPDVDASFEAPLGTRTWIVPAFAHPVGTATMLPGIGGAHRELMERYAHIGVLTAMVHDLTPGRVRSKGQRGLTIDYWPDGRDRAELMFGLARCVEALFAAGARRVFVPSDPVRVIERPGDAAALEGEALRRGAIDISAVHPMASVPMGDDPNVAAVDSRGRHHHLEGLWIGDGSLFCSSIGGPPQLTIYALGLQVGEAIVAAG